MKKKIESDLIRKITESVINQSSEQMNSEFTRVVQTSSVENILSYFDDSRKKEVEQIIETFYLQEMGLKGKGIKHLTIKEGFDRFSYAAFKVYNELISPEIKNEGELIITGNIGKEIYQWMGVNLNNNNLIKGLYNICDNFQQCGYYTKAKVIIDEKGWEFIPSDLKSKGETKIAYEMKDPVILPSAIQLKEEYGSTCQHFSSRTIQAALSSVGLKGSEVGFDVREHSADKVLEHWIIKQ